MNFAGIGMSKQNSIKTGMDVLNLGIERLCEEGRKIKAEEERKLRTLELVDELDMVFGDNFHSGVIKSCIAFSYCCFQDHNKAIAVAFPLGIVRRGNNYFLGVMIGCVERNGKMGYVDYEIDVSKITGYRKLEING